MTRVERFAARADSPLLRRIARAAHQVTQPEPASTHEATVRDIAAGVVAPMAIGFVTWAADRARQAGAHTAHFIARDGQLLERVARIVFATSGAGVSSHYLYGSRQAWRLPAVEEIGAFELAWMLEASGGVSVERIAGRVGLPVDEVVSLLRAEGALGPSNLDAPSTPLGRAGIRAVGRALTGGPLGRAIVANAAASRAPVMAYLRQSGLDRPGSVVVDLGWRGTMIHALAPLVRAIGGVPPEGYLVGIDRFAPVAATARRLHGWLYDGWHARGLEHREPGALAIAESFFRADHGLVLGYEQRDGSWAPLFADDTIGASPWDLALVHDTVAAVAEGAEVAADDLAESAGTADAVGELWKHLVRHPTPDEAAHWGAFEHDREQVADWAGRLAIERTAPDLLRTWMRTGSVRHHADEWLAGSGARSGVGAAAMLRAAQAAEDARSRLVTTKWTVQALVAGTRALSPER